MVADKDIGECKGEDWDVIALPGGMPGAERLRDNKVLEEMLKEKTKNYRANSDQNRGCFLWFYFPVI